MDPIINFKKSQSVESAEPILVEYATTQQNPAIDKKIKVYEKALKIREGELETIKGAFMEREKVLEEREYALDIRDAELDQRSNNIDKQVLETDKRLKEREDRLGSRERALSERESDILKLAETREQEIDRLTRERETAALLREKALEDREQALEEREKKVEEREIRIQKRMEANRKRFQRRRELQQIEHRIGLAPSSTTTQRTGRALFTSQAEIATQATTNHPRRIIERVTLRKVPSDSAAVSESTAVIFNDARGGASSLSRDEQIQVTEAVAYESAKDYATVSSVPVKGDIAIVQSLSDNSVLQGTSVSSSSGKKRKSGKRRARQRRQGHHHDETKSHKHGARKHKKVRKVVKRMGTDGTMVIVREN